MATKHDEKMEAAGHFKEVFETTVETNDQWIACVWRLLPDGKIQRVITTTWQWPHEAHAGVLETLEANLRETAQGEEKLEVAPLPDAETIGRFMDRVEQETARRLEARMAKKPLDEEDYPVQSVDGMSLYDEGNGEDKK